MLRSRLFSASVVAALLGSFLAAVATPAEAVQTAQATVANAVPATYTPDVNDGVVYSFTQVGSTVFAGGSFTNETPHKSTTVNSQPYLFGFTEGTGAIVTSFAPVLDGEVDALAAGPAPNEVYAAGKFKTVNGVKERVALLDATTGQIVPGWKPAAFNGNVNSIQLFNGQLIIGGYFSLANNSVARAGLASLDANTGALTNFVANQFAGHHNYGTPGQCDPTKTTCASAGVGVKAFDISPDGSRLVAIGNFTSVDGQPRDQAAMLDISQAGTAVDPNWQTLAFTAQCFSGAFDSYVRDIQFSPDGSYFVIVATGGSGTNSDGTNSSCDTAARYETSDTGNKIRPTWIDYTGQDTFWSVAISGTAIYCGGHERWVNNSKGFDTAGAGAVPRPGIAAFDPQNGIPISWNPGRNPRGAGAYALLLTSKGLYVGSDTDYIGNYLYHHKKIAFFPLAGGKALPANTIGSFPGKVFLVGGPTGSSNLRSLSWDGSSTPAGLGTFSTPGISWNVAHGSFYVNGNVYYGETDGYLHMRSFDGRTFGPDITVDPYDDPYWSNVKTGSGTSVYRGKVSTMSSEMKNVTSMFYSGGRIYYTLSTSSSMYWRWFEPESGITGSDEFTTNDGLNWSNLSGAFLVGSTLYFAKSNSTTLQSVPFVNGKASGAPSTANNTPGIDWRSAGAFVLAKSQINNAAPTARFTLNCDTNDTACTFDASGSSDTDGSVVQYDWNFGDGTTDSTSSSSEQHTYTSPGQYTVSLTVTDNDGGTGSVSHDALAGVAPAQPIAFVADNHATGNNTTSVATTIPSATQAGDGLLLFESRASTTVGLTPPAGWQLVGSTARSNMSSDVYQRVATDSDAGSTVTLNFSGTVKSSIVIAAYSNTDATTPVETAASATSASSASVTAPALSGLSDGTFIVRIFGDKSSATTGWTDPADMTHRDVVLGTGTGTVNDLLVDSNGAVGSSVNADAATTNDVSGSEAGWTIALKQVTAG